MKVFTSATLIWVSTAVKMSSPLASSLSSLAIVSMYEAKSATAAMTADPIDFGAEEASRVYHTDREPTMVELYSRALAHNVQRLPNFARFSLGTARKVAARSTGAPDRCARARPCPRAWACRGAARHFPRR